MLPITMALNEGQIWDWYGEKILKFGQAATATPAVELKVNAATQAERELHKDVLAGFRCWVWLLGVLTAASRLMYMSAPYFVDGPRHVRAVTDGYIFISPPGYFLFNELVKFAAQLLRVPVASAISILNVTFSVLGVMVFAHLVSRLFPGGFGVLLAFCYAFSDIVWFVADIHSTYAAMTLFAPALLYTLWFQESGWLAGLIWATMTGLRPSDGVFVLPFVVFTMARRGRRQIVILLPQRFRSLRSGTSLP